MNRFITSIISISCAIFLLSGCVASSTYRSSSKGKYPATMTVPASSSQTYLENFDDNSKNWPLNKTRSIVNCAYVVKDTRSIAVPETGLDLTGDWKFEATLELNKNVKAIWISVSGKQGNCSECGGLELRIMKTGKVYAYRKVKGKWLTWVPSKLAVEGVVNLNKPNTLAIGMTNGTAMFYINKKKISSKPYHCFTGTPKVGSGSDSALIIHNLAAYQYKSSGITNANCFDVTQLKIRNDCWKKWKKNGPHRISKDLVYDIRYNRMWTRDRYWSWYKKHKLKPPKTTFANVEAWAKELNRQGHQGSNDWILPTFSEYHKSFGKGLFRGYKVKKMTNPVHPEVKKGFPLYRDKKDREASFINTAVLMCKGPFDYLLTLRGETRPIVLSKKTESSIVKIRKAFKAGLTDIGDLEMMRIIGSQAHELYDTQAWQWMISDKIPLKYYGKVLQTLYSEKKNDPAFFMEYAQVALLAGQPGLAQAAVRDAEALFKTSSVWKKRVQKKPYLSSNHITEMCKVIRALAHAEVAYQTKSAAPLKEAKKVMFGPEWTDNPYLLPYLNTFGRRLFEDRYKEGQSRKKYGFHPEEDGKRDESIRKEWAVILGYPSELLPLWSQVTFSPKTAEFTELSTGQDVKKMLYPGNTSKTSEKQIQRKVKSKGRVLD